ncbi:MAG: ATP-binding protein [Blastocatellia bacterium]
MTVTTADKEVMTRQTANQRALAAALAVVRGRLVSHAQAIAQTPDPALRQVVDAATNSTEAGQRDSLPSGLAPAFETLCQRFHLSPFERDLLLLCAGMELDSSFAALCAAAQGDVNRPYPTFSLALAEGPLRRWRLVEFVNANGLASAPLTTRPLRIDERVLQYLTGIEQMDERLAAVVEPVHSSHRLPAHRLPAHRLMESHQELAERIAAEWMRSIERHSELALPVILLHGRDAAEAEAIAALACASVELKLHTLAAHNVPNNPAERQTLIRLWERESVLGTSALLLDCSEEEDEPGRAAIVNDFIERLRGALIVFGRDRRELKHRRAIALEIPRPTAKEQQAVWQSAMGDFAPRLNSHLARVASQFNLSVPAIHAAAAEVQVEEDSLPRAFDLLWEACRRQARPRLESLAQRIEARAAWDDLVLPEAQKQTLRDLLVQVRQRAKVYEEWGFGAKSACGYGVTALFAGASGTGKTMAAEVLANELRLDLYRIDLSSVVSKYVGETEKNLRRVFDAAETGGAILLFDEADALFGKRSEVKDSHDRYANLEVSYLLQRMESYRGLAILTTNLKHALDMAFQRRLNFIVEFPFPDTAQRAEIWRRVFPSATPTEGLDFDRLAQLNVAGGNIRNIAIHAASIAAEVEDVVRMEHLLAGTRGEYGP